MRTAEGATPRPATQLVGPVAVTRLDHLAEFYRLLDILSGKHGGRRLLPETLASPMATRGVYFFFEPGEHRQESGSGPRVVRVGTHALNIGSSSTLRGRLKQHSGSRAGGGNHRGSIFRLLTGDALLATGAAPHCRSWGVAGQMRDAAQRFGTDTAVLKREEGPVEQAVSARLSKLCVLWLGIDDAPGPESMRGRIERNAIGLLSNSRTHPLDPPSGNWLGQYSSRNRVKASGLWNQNHVDEPYDPKFLDDLARLVEQQ